MRRSRLRLEINGGTTTEVVAWCVGGGVYQAVDGSSASGGGASDPDDHGAQFLLAAAHQKHQPAFNVVRDALPRRHVVQQGDDFFVEFADDAPGPLSLSNRLLPALAQGGRRDAQLFCCLCLGHVQVLGDLDVSFSIDDAAADAIFTRVSSGDVGAARRGGGGGSRRNVDVVIVIGGGGGAGDRGRCGRRKRKRPDGRGDAVHQRGGGGGGRGGGREVVGDAARLGNLWGRGRYVHHGGQVAIWVDSLGKTRERCERRQGPKGREASQIGQRGEGGFGAVEIEKR